MDLPEGENIIERFRVQSKENAQKGEKAHGYEHGLIGFSGSKALILGKKDEIGKLDSRMKKDARRCHLQDKPDPYQVFMNRAVNNQGLACESAGGRILSGEGVLGLCGAFLSAGIPAVVATLWPVDDRTTAELMTVFYEELARGETVARSLRRAQMAIRQGHETGNPFFWAGFVLVGDGECEEGQI